MRPRDKLLCAALLLLAGCRFGHHTQNNSRKDVDAIKAKYALWKRAFEARDLNGVMAIYAPDVVAYDVAPPLELAGTDAYRKQYSDLFGQFNGQLKVTYGNIHVEQSGDTAYAFGLERLRGTTARGKPVDMWIRFSDGWKRNNGQWFVEHEHVSVPVDLATGKARLDLTP
jgi:ketosteroid isomerase-like protein